MQADTPNSGPGRVHLEIRGRMAVLRIDNPPVNAGTSAVRRDLTRGIAEAAARGGEGAVILGAGRCFMAGSDLREFGGPLAQPDLPAVIRTIEAAPFPVVVALHGVALGGGLELALGCDWRIAAPATVLGLPEVSLGFVPGAGGTQRLPRLIGCARAIELICSAGRITAEEAAAIGLIDEVVEGDLVEAAARLLAGRGGEKRPVKSMSAPVEAPAAIDAAAETALRRGRGRPNVAEAIRLIRLAGDTAVDVDATLAEERAVFQKLRLGADAFALRYLFFAERRAARVEGLDMGQARPVESVAVIGGGTMGRGIARACLAAGLKVQIVERDAAVLEGALAAVGAYLDRQVDKGRLTAEGAEGARARLGGTLDNSEIAGCDLAIEAVFEDMDVKRAVIKGLEDVLAPGAVIASNTSYLDIDVLAAGLTHPERVIGLHFFSPAEVMPLLEVVRAARTSNAVLATCLKLARRLGKQPVVAAVAEGFIGNRVYAAYRERAERLVLEGANPDEIDAAAAAFGMAMGPFEVADLSGLDIAWSMRKRRAAAGEPANGSAIIADRLCEAGRLGRKSGKGWYDYSQGAARLDDEVRALIATARKEAGLAAAGHDATTIQRQLLAAMVNAAACLVDEGVAQRASDVDVALANGYGFPRWRGGPLYWAATQDRRAILDDQAALARAAGPGHRVGPVAAILDQIEIPPEG